MNLNVKAFVFFLASGILLSLFMSSKIYDVSGKEKLGNVQFSILPLDEFLEENGEGWVLMSEQDITNTALSNEHGIDKLPRGDGRFIRIIDLERDEKLRVDKDRQFDTQQAGDNQDDATKLPNQSFTGTTTTTGNHEHKENEFHYVPGGGLAGGNGNPRNREINTRGGGAHDHSTQTTGGGDYETRPKNIILYAYIKVN